MIQASWPLPGEELGRQVLPVGTYFRNNYPLNQRSGEVIYAVSGVLFSADRSHSSTFTQDWKY